LTGLPTFESANSNQTNPNVVKNSPTGQLGQVKGAEMNDRDFVNDILATEKYLTDGLNTFTREASNQQLYDEVSRVLQETHRAGRDLFNLMFEKGWYKLPTASQQEIQQSTQQFQNYQTQFPY
jgi:spore coat protein CotF